MFTGLIASIGRVASLQGNAGGGARIRIEHGLTGGPPEVGESVSVDGVCLTALDPSPRTFEADLSPETLARSTLGHAVRGRRVNLERALAVGERFGGHLVQGHVDGVGRVEALTGSAEEREMVFRAPDEVIPYLLPKGSIAVDGISLTVARLESPCFTVAVIPHTLEATTLSDRRPGDRVNLEGDLVVRAVVATLGRLAEDGADHGALRRALLDGGWLDAESPVE